MEAMFVGRTHRVPRFATRPTRRVLAARDSGERQLPPATMYRVVVVLIAQAVVNPTSYVAAVIEAVLAIEAPMDGARQTQSKL